MVDYLDMYPCSNLGISNVSVMLGPVDLAIKETPRMVLGTPVTLALKESSCLLTLFDLV